MFERAAERFLVEQNASLEILDELRRCRLIELTDDTFSFEHELLFDYFKAENLRRQVSNAHELADELRKPRNQQFVELLVPKVLRPVRYRDDFGICRRSHCPVPSVSRELRICDPRGPVRAM